MQITEIRAINGPYPPTFAGIEHAVEACYYDQELGKTENNNKLLVVREDGSQEPIMLRDNSFESDYEAAEIAHGLGVDHDGSICGECALA